MKLHWQWLVLMGMDDGVIIVEDVDVGREFLRQHWPFLMVVEDEGCIIRCCQWWLKVKVKV